jgi:hypothetical protein
VKELLSNVGSGGGAPAAGAPAAAAGGAAPAGEAPAEEKKEEEKEESDDDMVRIYSVCLYALMYAYVISNRALVSSTDLRAVVLIASSSPCISHRAVFPPCITRINNNTFALVGRAFAGVSLVVIVA